MLKLALGCAVAALALILSTAKVIVAAELSLLTVSLLAAALGLVVLAARAAGEPNSGHTAA
ncbi:hypothetical protein [Pseudomonas sp. RGM 3321]|uniref:hypothetical protein n=1 Tax=Pseudomonas sp. RGM 3321 TaxID=2930089 RepID=UPI001FCAAFE0|nr:hypothetical protein [Pseudomonas sp. RGM 3321]MCJ2372163.1 hypothetical protein [Pseudomonas sp. RGM 3321]